MRVAPGEMYRLLFMSRCIYLVNYLLPDVWVPQHMEKYIGIRISFIAYLSIDRLSFIYRLIVYDLFIDVWVIIHLSMYRLSFINRFMLYHSFIDLSFTNRFLEFISTGRGKEV